MKRKLLFSISTFILFVSLVFGYRLSAYAQSPSAGANQTQRIENLKNRASQEITKRINSLNNLTNRINQMVKLSSTDKGNLVNLIQAEINVLTQLNTKIQGDTDLTTLRTDVQSITNAYRVYWLFMPKTGVLAAADGINDIADNMTTFIGKLQSRISQAQAKGKDVTTLNEDLSDAQSKVADARTQAANATNAVLNLQPDNGNNSVLQSNIAALKSARGMIKNAVSDLRAGYTDFKVIVQTLRSWGAGNNGTPSPVPSQ